MSKRNVLHLLGALSAAFSLGGLASCSENSPEPGSTGGSSSSGGETGGVGPTGGSSAGGASAGGSGGSGSGGLGAGGLGAGGLVGSGGQGSGGVSSGGAGGGAPSGATWAVTETRIGGDCGNSICHGGTEMLCLAKDADRSGGEGSFCLPGTSLHETLLGTNVEQCGNVPLVDPGHPEGSAILLLMTRQCGDFVMPANCPPEDQGYPTCWPEYAVAELSAWIADGALAE